MKPNSNCFSLRPATCKEASLFYLDDQADRSLGTVGHVRMDFGSSGKGFYHTWWPHNGEQFNTPEFKEALQQFVDAMRTDGPLRDLPSMDRFCRQNGGAITEDGLSYGYLAEMAATASAFAVPPAPGNTSAIFTAMTCASRHWTGRWAGCPLPTANTWSLQPRRITSGPSGRSCPQRMGPASALRP